MNIWLPTGSAAALTNTQENTTDAPPSTESVFALISEALNELAGAEAAPIEGLTPAAQDALETETGAILPFALMVQNGASNTPLAPAPVLGGGAQGLPVQGKALPVMLPGSVVHIDAEGLSGEGEELKLLGEAALREGVLAKPSHSAMALDAQRLVSLAQVVGEDKSGPLLDLKESLLNPGAQPAGPQTLKALSQFSAEPLRQGGIEHPLNSPDWGKALGSRLVWMADAKSPVAQLRLNPPHLGPLEVRVSMDGDNASVSFSSHHAPVREAIEAAMPRLREILGENGITLTQADVSHQQFSQQEHGDGERAQQGGAQGGTETQESADTLASGSRIISVQLGLVDFYA